MLLIQYERLFSIVLVGLLATAITNAFARPLATQSECHVGNSESAASRQWWHRSLHIRHDQEQIRGAGITIALIDSGVDLSHPLLRDRLDGRGANFGDCNMDLADCSRPDAPAPQDQLGHGTQVAGVLVGPVVGVAASRAKLLPIKINPGTEDDFSARTVSAAIRYAVLAGAHLIHLSFAMPNATQAERSEVDSALSFAEQSRVVVVVAGGNHGPLAVYPATHPSVIAVGGIGCSGEPLRGTAISSEIVVAAPAEQVQTTLLGGGTGPSMRGTSIAAPFVTATLANLLALNPDLTAAQMRAALMTSATPLRWGGKSNSKLHFKQLGFGLLNVQATKGRLNKVGKPRAFPSIDDGRQGR
ncbi:S8 family serine peptidase [Inhella sp.]|uniref:S8 family peptidase n=1 Tax=Inhella sp. TaxID=1921806 RepID=UPI0035AE0A8A